MNSHSMYRLVFLLLIVPTLAGWGCPGIGWRPKRLYADAEEAGWHVPSCTVDSLTNDAIEHFDQYNHLLTLPDPWYSWTCHIPSEALLQWEAPDGRFVSLYDAYSHSIQERLREHYKNERVLIVRCGNGGYWPAHGGVADFYCEWRLPYSWLWNASIPCRHTTRVPGNIVDNALCPQ
jgi:hypothetical protein